MNTTPRMLHLVPPSADEVSREESGHPSAASVDCRVSLDDLITIEAAMIMSWARGEGRVLTLTGAADPWRVGLVRAVAQRALSGPYAVAYFQARGDEASTVAFPRSLSAGQSPILSSSCARMVAAMNDAPFRQAHLLEQLLRRHARHRPIFIGIDGADHLDPRARWMLRRLSDVLCDCPVTWLFSHLGAEP